MNILGSVKFWLDDVYDNPKEIYKTPMRNIRSFKDSFKRSCRWFARTWNDSDTLITYLVRFIVYKMEDMRYRFDNIDIEYVDLRHQPEGGFAGDDSDLLNVDNLEGLDKAIDLGNKLIESLLLDWKLSNSKKSVWSKFKHSTKWFFRMWNNHDYDYEYINEMILYKLNDINECYHKHYNEYCKDINDMITIGNRIVANDYVHYTKRLRDWYDTHDIFSSDWSLPDELREESDAIHQKAAEDETNDRNDFYNLILDESIKCVESIDHTIGDSKRREKIRELYNEFYNTIRDSHQLWWS